MAFNAASFKKRVGTRTGKKSTSPNVKYQKDMRAFVAAVWSHSDSAFRQLVAVMPETPSPVLAHMLNSSTEPDVLAAVLVHPSLKVKAITEWGAKTPASDIEEIMNDPEYGAAVATRLERIQNGIELPDESDEVEK